MGRTLTWECIWYRPKPEGFTERTYGKVYGLYFHYKDIITTLWTTWKMKERRRSPKVLTLNTTGFILCIYFQAWLLCTCDFPWLPWFQSSQTCFSLTSHYSTSMSPCSYCLHSFSYLMTKAPEKEFPQSNELSHYWRTLGVCFCIYKSFTNTHTKSWVYIFLF